MGIEKMSFIEMEGEEGKLDEVLALCLDSGMFQPDDAAKLTEYSVGAPAFSRNPWSGLLTESDEIAKNSDISDPYTPSDISFTEDTGASMERLRSCFALLAKEYPAYLERCRRNRDAVAACVTALQMLGHVDEDVPDFDRLWANRFLKMRFGRLPVENREKLTETGDKPCEIIWLDEQDGWRWCIYFTAPEYRDEMDKMFLELGFERLRIPEFVHGTASGAVEQIRELLAREQAELREAEQALADFVRENRERFQKARSEVCFRHDAYALRRYVVLLNGRFHLIGFVRKRDEAALIGRFSHLSDSVRILAEPASGGRLPVPVQLRNIRAVKPFEMFVGMYGAPSYADLDPTPFLALTYTVLFGMMYGDMGHGLCLLLVGWYLWKKKNMELGGIMTRIGVSSMLFGFCYGSIFGFEHLLDPLFRRVWKLPGKPVDVLNPDTTGSILMIAVALGAVCIITSILFNIFLGFKNRDLGRAILSSNGICGLIFYSSVLFGFAGTLAGARVFTAGYVVFLIVVPLLLIFFSAPILRRVSVHRRDQLISSDRNLETDQLLYRTEVNIPDLFTSPFMAARFGRIPTDSYRKLSFYETEPFLMHPVRTDREYIWLIYNMALPDKARIDAIFRDLYFERIYIPEEDLQTPQSTRAFIRRCIEGGSGASPGEGGPAPSGRDSLFPEGIGAFLMETFFEMFEVVLSFISNTMSFLRVGGFVLVHAGMMSVVFTLAEMAGAGAGVAILIVGNVFVMVLEGLIVGIQVLRLEFYEMFSRFYGETGEPFVPATVRSG